MAITHVNYTNSITGGGPLNIISGDPSTTTISIGYVGDNEISNFFNTLVTKLTSSHGKFDFFVPLGCNCKK